MTTEHTAKHHLPTSNGWSRSSGHSAVVYCGRCRDVFAVDEEWADRYERAHGYRPEIEVLDLAQLTPRTVA